MLLEALDYELLSKLVSRTQMGDSDSFAELFAATYRKQYRFAYRYLKNQFLAQDVIEELYFLALENICALRDTSLFTMWLDQMNFRLCLKVIRDQHESQNSPQTYAGRKVYLDNEYDAIELVSRQKEHDAILEELFALQLRESQVIIMKYYHGMKLQEISEVLDISKREVKMSLRDARYRLKHTLRRENLISNRSLEDVMMEQFIDQEPEMALE